MSKRWLSWVLPAGVFYFFLVVSSCISGPSLKGLRYSLEELRSAIQIVAVEVRWSDLKKRRFESRYFILEETKPDSEAAKKTEAPMPAPASQSPSSGKDEDDWEKEFAVEDDLAKEFEESKPVKDKNKDRADDLLRPRPERRAFARFFIIGDRRPFEVVIQVIEEEKQEKGWVAIGKNKELALRLAQELQEVLEKGRVERNAIDSLKPF